MQEVAEKYTLSFFELLDSWEGIYLASWESKILTHSTQAVIGKVMREGDDLKDLQNSILEAPSGVYNTGIMASPATGQLIISMYAPVYDGDKIVGYVGGASLASGLKELLDKSKIVGLENAEYSFVNIDTGVYIFDKDEQLINTEIKDTNLLEMVEKAKNGVNTNTVEYEENGEKYFSVYKVLEDRGWMLVIRDRNTEIFAKVHSSTTILGVVCACAVVLISLLSWIVLRTKTLPFRIAVSSIEQLKNLNLAHNDAISKYKSKKDEVGSISVAVESLIDTFRDIVGTMDKCSESLSSNSMLMNNTSQELMNRIETDASTTEELSASIINTNNAIAHVSHEISEMKEMAKQIQSCVEEGNQNSDQLMNSSTQMTELAIATADNSNKKMEVTKDKINAAITNLQSLNKINDMATQILDITSQTNLLSLNASIEAARAGEAGKGFAVVADEIAKLANSSSNTVSQIQSLCKEAELSICNVQECFQDITDFLETDISKQLGEFAKVSEKYNIVVNDIKNSMDAIETSTTAFVNSVSNIATQVEHVNEASQQNEKGVEQMIENNNETTKTVDHVMEAATENRNNAEALQDLIHKFSR